MQMNLNQKRTSGASACGFGSQALREVLNLAEYLSQDISKAQCAADLGYRHATDNGVFKDVSGSQNDIYFPPHERKILDFIMDDVNVRLITLEKMADDLSGNLKALHAAVREAEQVGEK